MSTKDWIEKDFYAELGVSKDTPADDIKKSYRRLARQFHPDHNKGDKAAEERFKAISEAYDVLSDATKRAEYDEARALFGTGGFRQRMPGAGGTGGMGGAGGQSPYSGGTFDFSDLFGSPTAGESGGFGDVLGGIFGGGSAGRRSANAPRRGSDIESEVTIAFEEAVTGLTVSLRMTSDDRRLADRGDAREPGTSLLNVRIPAGVRDGQKIRLKGKGARGERGGPDGDLLVVVHVSQHRLFARKDDDLLLTVPVSFAEAALGTALRVPTLDGQPVTLRIPAGTANGRTFRVRGRGIARRDGTRGDLRVTVEVAVPATLSDRAREAVEALQAATAGDDPRAGLFDEIAR